MSGNERLEAALSYAMRGWHVFPLMPGGKVPFAGTRGFRDATTDPETIQGWWQEKPDANVGIATGSASGLVVLDIDPRAGGDLDELVVEYGDLPDTPQVHTGGGGQHLYFEHPGGSLRGATGVLGPGVDVKADGGYVVAPPSVTARAYEWEVSSGPDDVPLAPLPAWIKAAIPNGISDNGRLKELPRIPQGCRNSTLTQLAGRFRRPGASEPAIEAALLEENRLRCDPPLELHEVRQIARSIARYEPDAESARLEPVAIPPPRTTDRSYRLDDVGNAERLLDAYEHLVKYCPQWRAWLVWDGTRWRRDDSRMIYEFARRSIDLILDAIRQCDDDKERAKLAKHHTQSRRHRAMEDMLKQAATMQRIVVRAERLNADPWLLNVRNGTVDLRTGERRAHRQRDLITRLAPVEHDPDATAPTWARTLGSIFEGHEETIAFFQRWAGYALTGIIKDHVVLIAYGTGRNGKSTVVEALRHVYGDYATSTAFAAFVESYRDDAGARPDLVRLRGARLITTTEGTFGKHLDESTIKRLSGGDTIYARGMREDGGEFRVVGKAILLTNHRPLVRGTDVAIKSRLRFLPFRVSFAGREDRELPEQLKGEASGILNWALAGCRAFLEQGGVGSCPDVDDTTRDFFDDMDVIQEFLDVWTEPGTEVLFGELYDAYKYHCHERGMHALSGRNLAERLNEKGIAKRKRGGKVYRIGIRLCQEVPEGSVVKGVRA